jgi:uncharacterized membrane protein
MRPRKSHQLPLQVEPLESRVVPTILVAVIGTGGGNDAGLIAIRDQLNDDTYFDFSATLVPPSGADTTAELDAFDVVVIGNNGFRPSGDKFAIYQSALKSWVDSGGGAVATGYTVYGAGTGNFRSDTGTTAAPDIDFVVPVNSSGGYDAYGNTQSLIFNGTPHPVVDSLSDFAVPSGTVVEAPYSSPQVDSGATVLATVNDQPTIVVGSYGAGRTVYLGPAYAGLDSGNAAWRTGTPDQLLEQAVHWAARAPALLDFGDAPDSYGTLLGSNGARHAPTGPMLGSGRDAETEAVAPLDGTGDVDDGVVFMTTLIADATVATTASLSVNATGGKLDAWIDFNRDGDFNDAGEQIFAGQTLATGDNLLNFTATAGASPGGTFARFRVSSAGGLSPTGLASDGEVEDYAITIVSGAPAFVNLPTGSVASLARVGDDLVVSHAGFTLFSAPLTTIASLTINGTDAEDDTLIVDFSGGDPVPSDGFTFDGRAGDDVLEFSGSTIDIDIAGTGTNDGFRGVANTASPSSFDNVDHFAGIVPPSANAGGPYAIYEGEDLSLDGSNSIGSTGLPLTYEWDLNGDDDYGDVSGATPSQTWAQLQALGIVDGPATLAARLRVGDGVAAADTSEAPFIVNNVAPTATFTNNGPIAEKRPISFSFSSQFDPSAVDTAAGFSYSYDFNNDGDFVDPGDIDGASSADVPFVFASDGTYVVHGQIRDQDGGARDYYTTATVLSTKLMAIAPGLGADPKVKVIDAATGAAKFTIQAFAPTFRGGLSVASGDLTGDGIPDIVVGQLSLGRTVNVFDGVTGTAIIGMNFDAFPGTKAAGVFVAAGDVNGDGRADIIVGAGPRGQTRVRVISGADGAELKSFVAFSSTSTAGVHVAAGDVNGDGKADVIASLSSGPPVIRVFDISAAAANPPLIKSFNAFPAISSRGLFVAAGDLNGDGKAEVIAAQDLVMRPKLRVLNGLTGALISETEPFKGSLPLGVRVALVDRDGDGMPEIAAATGYGVKSSLRFLKGTGLSVIGAPQLLEPVFLGGIFVG